MILNYDLGMTNFHLRILDFGLVSLNRELVWAIRELVRANRELVRANRELLRANHELARTNFEWARLNRESGIRNLDLAIWNYGFVKLVVGLVLLNSDLGIFSFDQRGGEAVLAQFGVEAQGGGGQDTGVEDANNVLHEEVGAEGSLVVEGDVLCIAAIDLAALESSEFRVSGVVLSERGEGIIAAAPVFHDPDVGVNGGEHHLFQ